MQRSGMEPGIQRKSRAAGDNFDNDAFGEALCWIPDTAPLTLHGSGMTPIRHPNPFNRYSAARASLGVISSGCTSASASRSASTFGTFAE
jgi:hypothetical protein